MSASQARCAGAIPIFNFSLTIHYELSLPGTLPEDEVRKRLNEFHQRCLDLPFENVSNMMEFTEEDCDFERHIVPDGKELDWDMEIIGEIADVIQDYLVKKGICTEMEFAPYVERE